MEDEDAAEAQGSEGTLADTAEGALSKRQQKRLARGEARAAHKLERRQREKEARQKAHAERLREKEARLAALTDEEREQERLAAEERLVQNQKAREERKAARAATLDAKHVFCVDLDFYDLMTPKERKSMKQQLGHLYSANKKADVPAQLHFCALDANWRAEFDASIENWVIHRHEAKLQEAFADRLDKVVYLTADSETEIGELVEGDVYVIGGIVDRNRYRNLTLERAAASGVRTARLPIKAHLEMQGTHILTVNQVYDILLRWLATKDWGTAVCQAVPDRKHKSENGESKPSKRQRRGGEDDAGGAGGPEEAEGRQEAAVEQES